MAGRSYTRRCHGCRERKLKVCTNIELHCSQSLIHLPCIQCDGAEPACGRCMEHHRQCSGYAQKLEFVHLDQRSMERATQSGTKRQSVTSKHTDRLSLKPVNTENKDVKFPARSHWDRTSNLNVQVDQVLAVPQNKIWFISLLEGSYVPNYPVKPYNSGMINCSSWMTKACALTSLPRKSEMLDNALLAVSLNMVGDGNPDSDSSKASLKRYFDALVGLRCALQPGVASLDENQIDICLVTGFSCGIYEMMANRSFESLLRHLGGVGAILSDRGVGNLQSATGRRTFYEYRSVYLPISLAMRRPNFLSDPEWIDPPWKASEPHGSTHLQSVMDVGFKIPMLLAKFDQTRASVHLSPFDSIAEYEMVKQLAHDVSKLQVDLESWESKLRRGNDLSQLYISRPARKIESPHVDDLGITFPISFDFQDWDMASGLIYRDMIQIFLNNLISQIIDYAHMNNLVLPSLTAAGEDCPAKQSLQAADRICQSIEYFFEDNKRLIGKLVILAPFECARTLYAQVLATGTNNEQLDVEIGRKSMFCEKVTNRIQQGGLPNWAKTLH